MYAYVYKYIFTYRLSRNTREIIELWSLLPAYKFNSLEDLLLTGQIPRMPGGRKTLWWSSEGSWLWTWHRFRRLWNGPWMEQFHRDISRCCIYVGISGTKNLKHIFTASNKRLEAWFCSIQQEYMSSIEWSNIFTYKTSIYIPSQAPPPTEGLKVAMKLIHLIEVWDFGYA